MKVTLWVATLTLILFNGRSAWASEGVEGEGSFRGAFASLSASMLMTFELAQSKEEPLSVPAPEAGEKKEPVPPPWMVGFCDVRGASGIAPLPALPVGDGEVAADESPCHESTLKAGHSIQRNKVSGAPSSMEAADPAVLPAVFVLPVWAEARELPRFDERHLTLPRGFARGIEEPPRG